MDVTAKLDARSAPPVVRRIGYFLLVMSGLSIYALVMASLHGRLRWYQLVGLPIMLVVGIGLSRERRWAYVGAVAFAGVEILWALVRLAIVVAQPSHVSWVAAMIFMLITLALAGPPLLLLGKPGLAWFQDRDLEPA